MKAPNAQKTQQRNDAERSMNETHLVSEFMSQILPVEAKRKFRYREPVKFTK